MGIHDFEEVEKFKYLGIKIDWTGAGKIVTTNKALHANKKNYLKANYSHKTQ